jgi:hypothetical protein
LVVAIGSQVLVAGMENGLVTSSDLGNMWAPVWMGQATQPVTCLLPSPDFTRDSVMLAGTGGDGIFRSTNAGRSWNLCNFGLRNFSVFCLAASPVWEWREPVFAGTEDGVYTSPNGGRAWKFSGLPGQSVLSLATYPYFSVQPILLAGVEAGGLWRSDDGGRNWQPVDLGLESELSVNAVYHPTPENIILGTTEHGIIYSTDAGKSWSSPASGPESVLCLAETIHPVSTSRHKLYAGTYMDGLWVSLNGGQSWNRFD